MAEPELSLRDLIADLTKSVDRLAAATGRDISRVRKANFFTAITLVALATFVLIYYFIELPSRRQGVTDKINDLACTAVEARPPGYSSTYDRIRRDYDCPPYVPGTVPDTPGQSTRTVTAPAPSPSSTKPKAARTASPAAQEPATATRTATRTVSATRTIVRRMPAQTHTERVTVTATPTCVLVRLICP